ncbi:TPA: hypothetical protein RNX16_002136 [Pasteurella multocida]|nr:hypothetical protein [[Pasteurella] aerogenes]HDX1039592.1 hypothetical protein [Pasteurella multocida]HDX1142260.1 hypothetical protein [Pasteurella multocida]
MSAKFYGYKRPDFNELKKFEYLLTHIESAAIFLNEHFINKEVIYSTNHESISLIFKRSNFMHLCGIQYSEGASEFFNLALIKQIDLSKIFIKKDGTTFQKLSVLSSINSLVSPDITLTEGAFYLNLSFDKALKTRKKIFALTLVNDDNKFVPQSLLNLKFMNNFPNGNKVTSIRSIHLQDSTETIYL